MQSGKKYRLSFRLLPRCGITVPLRLKLISKRETMRNCLLLQRFRTNMISAGTFASINDNFATYSKHVMEGNDVADEAKALEAQFKEMTDNIPLYIFDKGQQSDVSSKLADKQSQFEAMNKVDEQVLKLKKENITLADNLTRQQPRYRKEVEKIPVHQNGD